jgi:hypothetical protein
MKRQQLRVEVRPANEPIDLQQWANTYCRHVLALEGITSHAIDEREREPMKEAS